MNTLKNILTQHFKSTPWDAVKAYNQGYEEAYLKKLKKGVDESKAKSVLEPQFKTGIEPNIKPLYYFGDISLESPIVTISLNPAYSNKTASEHAGFSLDQWFDVCTRGCLNYTRDQAMHKVFKNTGKALFYDEWNGTDNKRALMHSQVVNLDWCPLYSEKFPSRIYEVINQRLIDHWDQGLQIMLKSVAPKLIFVHGTSLGDWVKNNTRLLEDSNLSVMKLKDDFGKEFSVRAGSYDIEGVSIPIIWSEYFINRTTNHTAMKALNTIIQSKL
jgi:hypothetical protein